MKKKTGLRLSKTTLFIFLLLFTSFSYAEQGFTRADRELLIEMRAHLTGIDKRFDQVDSLGDFAGCPTDSVCQHIELLVVKVSFLLQTMNEGFPPRRKADLRGTGCFIPV